MCLTKASSADSITKKGRSSVFRGNFNFVSHLADFGGGAEEKRAEAGGIVALADSRLSVLFWWDPNWVL